MRPVLDRLRPYLRGVNLGLPYLDETHRCPACGSPNLTRDQAWTYTATTAFPLYSCDDCTAWSRGVNRKHGVSRRAVV